MYSLVKSAILTFKLVEQFNSHLAHIFLSDNDVQLANFSNYCEWQKYVLFFTLNLNSVRWTDIEKLKFTKYSSG